LCTIKLLLFVVGNVRWPEKGQVKWASKVNGQVKEVKKCRREEGQTLPRSVGAETTCPRQDLRGRQITSRRPRPPLACACAVRCLRAEIDNGGGEGNKLPSGLGFTRLDVAAGSLPAAGSAAPPAPRRCDVLFGPADFPGRVSYRQ